MRAVLFGAMLSIAVPAALSAQTASPVPPAANATPAAPQSPGAAPVQPAAAATPVAAANPAAPGATNGQKICEYTTHDGMLIPLNHCESQSEADKRRRERQQNLREIQMNSLTFFGPRP
jgi:hypothetical protein